MTEDFQARSSRIGRRYEKHVAEYLESMGFTIIALNFTHASGIQFDIHAQDAMGNEVGIECKAGDADSTLPGMRRTDNIWKVAGYLFQLGHWARLNPGEIRPRYVVATTNRAEPGSRWARMCDEWQFYGHVEFMEIPYPKDIAA